MDNNLNLNLLRVFHAVARFLSFTRAAEELHLTQPGVSKHIKELETFYKARLFDRLGKKVVLTQAGELVFNTTRAVNELLEDTRIRINDLHGLSGGKLCIGASITIGTYFLPNLLVSFREAYPGIDIKVDIALSRQVTDNVLNNTLELGLVGHYTSDSRLAAKPFTKDRMLLVVSKKHPWAARRTPVGLQELSHEPFLLSRAGSGTRDNIEALLKKAGVLLGNTMELGTTEGVKQAVEANLGISILSYHVVAKELSAGSIRQLRLKGTNLHRDLYLVHHKDRYLSAAARAFLKLLHGKGMNFQSAT